MNQETRNQVNQLNSAANFIKEEQLVKPIDRPILIIGLGGTGIDALVKAKYKINRTFQKSQMPGKKVFKDKPDNFEFLGIDTSIEAKSTHEEEIFLEDSELCVLLYNDMSNALNHREGLPLEQREFLHTDLTSNSGNGNGSGGKRQTARLMLMANIALLSGAIYQKIEKLTTGKENKLLVYILTGIGGGTGSGCFIDIAYLVRSILETRFSILPNETMFMGHIYLPDVNIGKTGVPAEVQEYCATNGYAALKELDYLMGLTEREEFFEQKYNSEFKFRKQATPFDFVHLISSIDTDGVKIDNGYEYCMNVAAENIVSFTSQSGDVSTYGYGEGIPTKKPFTLKEHYDNLLKISEQVQINELYGGACRYITLGASAMRLPTDRIMMYLSSLIFNKMSGLYHNSPKEEEILAFARSVRMDLDSMTDVLKSKIPAALSGYQKAPRYNWHSVIKTEAIDIDEELKRGYLKRAIEWFDQQQENLSVVFSKMLDNQLSQIFVDPGKGPIYANRIIVNENTITVLSLIRNYIRGLEREIAEADESIRILHNAATDAFNEARKALFYRNDKKNAYIQAKIKEYDVKIELEMNRSLIIIYTAYERIIRSKNTSIYNVVNEILEALKTIFDRNKKIVLEKNDKSDNENRTYYWDVINVPDIADSIGAYLDSAINTETLTLDFTSELLNKMDMWIGEDVDVAGFIRDFLANKFSAMVNLSLEAFIKAGLLLKSTNAKTVDMASAGNIDEVDLKDYLRKTLIPKLIKKATPLFAGSGLGIGGSDRITVTVPADPACKNIFAAFDEDRSWAAGLPVEIIKSEQKDRITVIRTTCAVPLYMYSRLQGYETKYFDLAKTQQGVKAIAGRHLRQSQSEDWEYLPSPIPEAYWKTNGYYREEVAERTAANMEIFDKALKYGAVFVNSAIGEGHAKYFCQKTVPFDVDEYAKASGLLENGALKAAKASQFLDELKKIIKAGLEVQVDERKEKIIKKIVASTDEAMARRNFNNSFILVGIAKDEIVKYSAIENRIAELEKILEESRAEKEQYGNFCMVMYTQTIVKPQGKTKYVFDPDVKGVEPVELIDILEHVKCPEYALYKVLEQSPIKDKVYEYAQAKRVEFSEDSAQLLGNIDGVIKLVQQRINALELTLHEMEDGQQILEFYKVCLNSLNDLKNVLS